LGILVVVLFLLLMLLRSAFHVRSLVEQRREEEALDPSVRGRDRLGGL
jgi:hypothetical protein